MKDFIVLVMITSMILSSSGNKERQKILDAPAVPSLYSIKQYRTLPTDQ